MKRRGEDLIITMKLEGHTEMKTADEIKREFEKSASSGVKCLKALMKEKAEMAQRKTEHADELEKKVKELKDGYRIAIQSQTTMKQQISDNEERLLQIEKKMKEIKRRLEEKLELLRETTGFTANPSIEQSKNIENRLAEKKKLLHEQTKKFNAAKERKTELENKKAMVECKTRANISKVSYLKTELHHANLKEERLKQAKKQIDDLQTATSSKSQEMEEAMDGGKRKVGEIKLRVSLLEANIESKEDEIMSMNINRKKLEGTIVNILTKIKEQHEKHRQIDIHYTLNKDSFVK